MRKRVGQKLSMRLRVLWVSMMTLVVSLLLMTGSAFADGVDKVDTSWFGEVDLGGKGEAKDVFLKLLYTFTNVLIYGLGALAVIGVVIAGVMYITAGDNEQKAVAARKRLIEVVIGLGVWALLYGILHLLIPGGPNLETMDPK